MASTNACDVSIIVVSFNTADLTLACLESVYRETSTSSTEVIVFDNASSDGSASAVEVEYPNAILSANASNLGFATANNVAASRANGRYILLLNPDTVVLREAIDKLVRFAERHPEYGIYGSRTVFPDGRLNPTSCWGKPTVWNSFCRATGLSALAKNSEFLCSDTYGGWQRDSVREVDLVSGCFLLIRRELWEELGGFDTSYFMYGEDWDLCLRARALGARCVLCPDAEIIHYGGASEPVRADKLVRLFETRVKLYRTHWGFIQSRLLIGMLWLWAFRSFAMDTLLGLRGNTTRKNSAKAWRDVLRRHKAWNTKSDS